MKFLPLVQRELRVMSRRKATYWLRAGIAVLCVPAALTIADLGRAMAGGGDALFLALASFILAIFGVAAILRAADCIGSERRDGTLGFLFLSNLRSHDVVLGKFSAVLLNPLYGLLATLPILGLCLLGGGVTFPEFWRVSAALINALFFATAFSICVSSRVRTIRSPVLLAFGLLAVLSLGGVIAVHGSYLSAFLPILAVFSPTIPFVLAPASAFSSNLRDFWLSLAASHLGGWLLLALAAWRLDKIADGQTAVRRGFLRVRRRRALLAANPITWLLDDTSAFRLTAIAVALLGASWAIFGSAEVSFIATWPFYLVLKFLVALQACRFFTESRQSGALEMLAVTSLSGREVIAGQWAALRRVFVAPFCILAAGDCIRLLRAEGFLAQTFFSIGMIWMLATQVMDVVAIGSFGMWLALSNRHPRRAALITVLVAIIAPLFLACIPNIFLDAVLISLASSRISAWQEPRSRPWEMPPARAWTAAQG